MTLSTAVFQTLKTPLAVVVVGEDDDCHFNLANKAFSRLVGYSEDVLDGLPPERLFAEWNNETLQSVVTHETSLLHRRADDDEPVRLLLTCEALAGADEPAYLLTAEDISAKTWIDDRGSAAPILLSGILNERFIVERYFKYYPAPVIDHLFQVENESINDFFHDSERRRIIHALEQSARNRRTAQIVVQTKELADSVRLTLDITYRPFFHGDGTLKNVAFIVTDIQLTNEAEYAVDPSVTLKVLMARNYMSAQQLAHETGISLQTISKLRNGKIDRPQRQTMLLIAKALNVTQQEIWP